MPVPVPVVIVTRDRLMPLLELVGWLDRAGCHRVHILDNDSRYPPLLNYLDSVPAWVTVHRLSSNLGGFAPWRTGFTRDMFPGEPYVVTDPDVVPDEGCPGDLIDHLVAVLDDHPDRLKVGPALRVDDLPAHYSAADDVRACEKPHWAREIAPGLYDAPIDTTFAVYRAGAHNFAIGPALRTGTPYTARHLGWYLDTANLTDEDRFYASRLTPALSAWNVRRRPMAARRDIHLRRTDGRGVRSAVYKCIDWMWARRWYPGAFWRYQVLRRLGR